MYVSIFIFQQQNSVFNATIMLSCPSCSMSHDDSNALEMHIAVDHLQYFAYECEHCELARFPTDYALRQHYLLSHRNEHKYRVSSSFYIDQLASCSLSLFDSYIVRLYTRRIGRWTINETNSNDSCRSRRRQMSMQAANNRHRHERIIERRSRLAVETRSNKQLLQMKPIVITNASRYR